MQHRKLRPLASLNLRPLVALTSAILASAAAARAEESPSAMGGLDEVIVTAQKRSENLQSVPISIQAFDSKKLEELQVASFDDYAKYLPSLSVQSYGPGQAQLYVRGVTNGGDGLKVGSQPLVGVYLDEMPVTTIGNNLDIHVYDIERVEALSGPQGTLFGSSSMAGTLRIITNKPDPAKTEGGFDLTLNTITKGAPGGKLEGFVNLPIGERAAVRLVAWHEEDGGYINNVPNPPETYPTSGAVRSNAALVKKNYNWVDTTGGRAALKINLDDTWSVTPTVQTQHQVANGQFGYTPFGVNTDAVVIPPSGDLNVSRFYPERNDDTWTQATLTVQGKIGNLDAIYAGGYLKRKIDSVADYSDYSFFYDVAYAASAAYFGNNFQDANGNVINPAQTTITHNDFSKLSHELRLSTPQDWRLRGVLGVFLQRQTNDTRDEYRVANLAPSLSITGEPGVLYLNSQSRVDRDSAVFTDLSFDIVPKLTLTGGIRLFRYDNSVYGFFGYNRNPPGGTPDGLPRASGESQCTSVDPTNPVRPCVNINSETKRSGTTYRVNLTYKFDDDRMLYSTWSTGFRPGGVNRVTTRPPYNPDYLTNIEAGWKTTWLDHRLRFNGAVFFERWKDAQFAVSGTNGITEITNASRSEIRGVEGEVHWKASAGLTLTVSATFLDAKLVENACNYATGDPTCQDAGNSTLAPSGSRLPVSSRFKGNAIARYEWSAGDYDAHVQLAGVYQTDAIPVLTVVDAGYTGMQPGYASFDLSGGAKHGAWSYEVFVENLTDKRGEVTRYTSCAPATCRLVNVIPIRPRMVGVTLGRSF